MLQHITWAAVKRAGLRDKEHIVKLRRGTVIACGTGLKETDPEGWLARWVDSTGQGQAKTPIRRNLLGSCPLIQRKQLSREGRLPPPRKMK